jgi:hypothetical protein
MRIIFLILFLPSITFANSNETIYPSPSPSPVPNQVGSGLWTAHVLREKNNPARISELTMPTRPLPVVMINKDGRIRPMIEIRFMYARSDWILFYDDNNPVLRQTGSNEMSVFFYLNSYVNEFRLKATGPKGEVEFERIFVYAPNIQEFQVTSAWDSILFSGGETLLNYEQTGYGKFRSLSAIFSAQYATPESESQFGFYAAGSLTMLTQWASPSRQNPQILEAKLDGTYRIETSIIPLAWRVQLALGANYMNMFNNNSPFGISNLASPDLGLRVKYYQDQKWTQIFDLRYMPLIVPVDLQHRGFTLGYALSYILPNYHRVELGVNYSDYYYYPSATHYIYLQALSITLGYGL